MRPLTVPSALIVVVAVGAACPPAPHVVVDAGSNPNETVDAGVVDATDYCESIVDFFCDYYVRCGKMAVPNADACKPVFLEACNARFEPTFASLAKANLLELSSDGIAQCKQHLETVQCDQQIQDLDGPCAQMWVGKQPAGAKCGFDIESFTCAPGTACVVDTSLCGTCEPVVPDGSSCGGTTNATCAPTSRCDLDSSKCIARKKVGEACSGNDCVLGASCTNQVCVGPAYVGVGDACDFQNRCPFFASCVNDGAGGAGACAQNVELGASCSTASPCDSGFCDGTTCQPLVAQGGTCTESAQCQTGLCDPNGTCSKIPDACFNP